MQVAYRLTFYDETLGCLIFAVPALLLFSGKTPGNVMIPTKNKGEIIQNYP